MRIYSILLLSNYLFLLLHIISCGPSNLEVISDIEEFFGDVTEIEIQGSALEVSYEGGAEVREVFLNGFLEASDRSIEGISYTKNGNKLRIEVKRDGAGSWWGTRIKGYIHIIGPEDMALNINSSSGLLSVSHVNHENIDLRISSGRMEVRDVRSEGLRLKASSGKISAEAIQGNVDLQVSSGRAILKQIKGDVRFLGSSGYVEVSEVEGIVQGKISSGKASLRNITELGEISLSSGRLDAREVGLGSHTRLSGSSGKITVTTLNRLEDFNYEFSVGSGSLRIGETRTSKNLSLNNGAPFTISGTIQSGRMDIVED